MPIRYIQIKELCSRLGCTRSFIFKQLRDPESKLPRPTKLGGTHVGRNIWLETEVEEYQAWLLSQRPVIEASAPRRRAKARKTQKHVSDHQRADQYARRRAKVS